jgi:hypothetical protein
MVMVSWLDVDSLIPPQSPHIECVDGFSGGNPLDGSKVV